jgi:aspartyl-tRNA(Asn)/glutamyl-tRNA(Gln) amidotransferase subunit B
LNGDPSFPEQQHRNDSCTVVIGLEVHVQLLTQSKLFCGCLNRFNPDQPNAQTCPVCLGLPGALPAMNRTAFQLALKTALALNCQIAGFTKWDRKQYYYPDLPKAYQISQYDLPFSHDGFLDVAPDEHAGQPHRIRIIRAHLEEDAGKNMHDESGRGRDSQIDLNRCGTPLLEIVSHPDLRSAAEARRYLEELKLLLSYLDVSDCNMQEGSLRCDANVNLHILDAGEVVETPIVEIKNMNSFRGVETALEYEARRQLQEWKETGRRLGEVAKVTRGWDAERGITFAQRSKEEASDYRYFPDPDLVPVTVSPEQIADIARTMVELPASRRQRLQSDCGISADSARVIIDQGAAFVDYFEQVYAICETGLLAANWMTQDVLRVLHEIKGGISDFPLCSEVLGELLAEIARENITTNSARTIFSTLIVDSEQGREAQPQDIQRIIQDQDLAIVSNQAEIQPILEAILANNTQAVTDFRSGKQGAVGPLIGQAMRQIQGADPKTVRQMLIDAMSD